MTTTVRTWQDLRDALEVAAADYSVALGLDPKDYRNRVSFGYIGNCQDPGRFGAGFDDRAWMIFLPHPGRVGTYADHLGSFRTGDVDSAVCLLALVEGRIAELSA